MEKCKSATFVVTFQPGYNYPAEPLGMVLTFTDKAARDRASEKIVAGRELKKEKLLLSDIEVDGNLARYFPNDTTMIIGETNTVRSMVLTGPTSLSLLTQSAAWNEAAKGTLVVAVDPDNLKTIMASAPPNPLLGIFSPFWMQSDNHTLGVSLREKAEIKLVTSSPDEKNAKVVEASVKSIVSMVTGLAVSQKETAPDAVKAGIESLETLLASNSVVRNGNQTTLTFNGDGKAQVDSIVGMLVPAINSAREAAQRTQQQNNFKQILLAMHNYEGAYGHFPPAVIVDADSGMKRSWRVELLPYLEHENLYRQYRKDQPWDSEANMAVLESMPAVFRHPSAPEGSTYASIFAAVGKGFVFEKDDKDGTKLSEITDGTSVTVCIVEAKRDIPWTKPEDIEMTSDADKLPNLGFEPEGFSTGFCDGSVRFISNSINLKIWNEILTRAGGEVISQF